MRNFTVHIVTKKKESKQTYFIDDIEVMSLRYITSSTGTVIAFRNKQGNDLHLTIYNKGLSLFSHIVYKNRTTGEEKRSSENFS